MKEHNMERLNAVESQTTLESEAYFKDFVFNMKMMILEINI